MTNPFQSLLNFIFPSACLGCGKEGSFLCEKCLRKIPINREQVCPVCKKPSLRGRVHGEKCASKTPLVGLIVAAKYSGNSVLDRAITQFKYRYSREMEVPLGKLLTEALQRNFTPDSTTFIVPIPLHPSRRRWRGFNQAEALSGQVGKALGIPVMNLLKREKKTRQQAKLTREERLVNVRNAFMMNDNPPQSSLLKKGGDCRILLVDDVASTLATLEEAAKVLRDAGYEDVTGVVLARG